ncbi:MAG TPA: glycosyltransferase [Acidimicrobiales bacterium]|nr:glycosyltransferase [Acidimicrobiales bacterium]
MTGPIRARLRGASASSLAGGGGLVLFVTLTVVNGSNFLFHAVISRRLEPALYGGLSALLTILLVLTVPVSALQLAITRRVAARREAGQGPGSVVIGPLLGDAVLWGVALSGALVLASPVVQSFLHLPTLSSAVMLGVYVLPAAIALIPRAVLLGQLRFRLVAGGLLAGAATRLVLGVVLVERGAGIDGAMAATVLGEVATAAVLLPALRAVLSGRDDVTPLRVRWADATGAVLAFTGFWVLTGIDTLLARHYFPRVESGLYAAAATGARTAMFFSAAVSLVAFPRFAQGGGGTRSRAALVQALGAVLLLGFSVAATNVVAPDLVVGVLFGTAYEGSSAVIGMLALSSATLGVVNVGMYYLLATDGVRAASWVWAGVGAAVVAATVGDLSPSSLAAVMLASTVGVALLMLRAVFAARPAEDRSAALVSEELWTLAEPEVDVTVVVPYFNPGPALRPNLEGLLAVLERCGTTYEVVAVSDGSTDGSERTIQDLRGPCVRLVSLPTNRGKGEALRIGLAMGRGRYVGFIDADGDVDPAVLEPFLALVHTYQPDVVLGSKRHPLSDVSYPRLRRVYSWGYQQIIRVLFRLNIRDSQTGVKLIRREVLAGALPRMAEKRFAFDLELFVVARHLGYRRFFEAPVSIDHQFESTISFRSVRGMLVDTLAIFYRLRLLRFYDRPGRRELAADTAAAIQSAVGSDRLSGGVWAPSPWT